MKETEATGNLKLETFGLRLRLKSRFVGICQLPPLDVEICAGKGGISRAAEVSFFPVRATTQQARMRFRIHCCSESDLQNFEILFESSDH